MRSVWVIASRTVSASREESAWKADWARSHRIVRSMSIFSGDAGDSSLTTSFSRSATCRASLSVASSDRK